MWSWMWSWMLRTPRTPITRSAVKTIISTTTVTTVNEITLVTIPLLTSWVEALVAFTRIKAFRTLRYSRRIISNKECHWWTSSQLEEIGMRWQTPKRHTVNSMQDCVRIEQTLVGRYMMIWLSFIWKATNINTMIEQMLEKKEYLVCLVWQQHIG